MPNYNCITDTTLLSALRHGATTLVAGEGETLTEDVGPLVEGVPLKYQHIDTGALAEMSAGEKTAVDAAVATSIIAARTLTKSDRYLVSQVTGSYVITLPVVAKNLKYVFLLIAEAALTITIRATSTHLYGVMDLAGTLTAINGSTDIIFDATDANIGDTISLVGIDSTHWCVSAISTDASGLSVA